MRSRFITTTGLAAMTIPKQDHLFGRMERDFVPIGTGYHLQGPHGSFAARMKNEVLPSGQMARQFR